MRGKCLLTIGVAGLLLTAAPVQAAGTPEQQCQKGRYAATAKYAACQHRAISKGLGKGGIYDAGDLGKCVAK